MGREGRCLGGRIGGDGDGDEYGDEMIDEVVKETLDALDEDVNDIVARRAILLSHCAMKSKTENKNKDGNDFRGQCLLMKSKTQYSQHLNHRIKSRVVACWPQYVGGG